MTAEQSAPAPARTIAALTVPPGSIDLIALGASAGGVEALSAVVGTLPADLDAAVLVVLHVSQSGTSVMPQILTRAGPLPASSARDGEQLLPGRIYVAPPGHHLTVDGNCARVDQRPRENGHRPAIDPLLRSAGQAFGERSAGVILSGARDDGTAGLLQLKQRGGIALAQDPESALYPSMPESAIAHVAVDAILPLEAIGPALAHLAGRARHNPGGPLVADPHPHHEPAPEQGVGTRFTCPDCGGVLFEYRDGSLSRFRCSVGHAYSLESFADAQARQLEWALWAASRTLEDRVLMLRRMERDSRANGHDRAADAFAARALTAAEQATAIREAIERGGAESPSELPDAPTVAAAPHAADAADTIQE